MGERLAGGNVAVALLANSIATGAALVALILTFGPISGAHFNPAVTLGFTLKRLFPATWMAAYWAAQVAGAVAAGLLLRGLFGDAVLAGVSTPHVAPAVALVLEAVLAWLLVSVILGTADRAGLIGPNAAIAVGGTIALCGLIALPIEGASMNPARSLGPALVTLELGDVWIYVIGPVLGSLLAVAITTVLHGTRRSRDEVEAATGKGTRSTR